MNDLEKKESCICTNPYYYCEIHPDGEIYPCCPNWCNKYSFGNIIEKTFDEIWNGEKAKDFRKKILAGDFSNCKTNICTYNNCIIDRNWTNYVKENYSDSEGNGNIREIKMCWDFECNVACITCRDEIRRNTEKDYARLEKIKKNMMPYIKDIDIFHCSGSGDPFASRYCREFIKDIANINKKVKFGIHTNGILSSENMFEKLGIKNRIHRIEISIHAATEKTYNKIVKYGNFNKVIENLEWISELNRQTPLNCFILTFVINNYNYKEIPAFINLAKKYNAKVCFYYFRYWDTEYGKGEEFDKIAVWKPEHPKFNEFLKIINTHIVKNCDFYYHADFMDLLNSGIKPKKLFGFIDKIFSNFKK